MGGMHGGMRYALERGKKTKERREDLMSSTVWFLVGVLTGSMEETSMFPADRQEAVGRAAHPSQCEEDIPF